MGTLRDQILSKYGVGTSGKDTSAPAIVDNSALKPSSNPIPATEQPAAKPAESLRDSILSKYLTSTVDQSGKRTYSTTVAPTQEPQKPQAIIASPAYFASSVDVRNKSGRFVETFNGANAYEEAKAYAEKIGGSVEPTPKFGFIGRAIERAKEVFTGAKDQYVEKVGEAISSLDSRNQGGAVDRSAKAVSAGVSIANLVLSPIGATFSAAEEVPVLKYPAIGLNYIFGKIGEGGGWVADKVVDNIPVSDQTKETIRPAAEELAALLAQLAAGKAGAKGTKVLNDRTVELRNQIKTAITKDVVTQYNLPRTVFIEPEKIKSIFQTGEKISPEELQLVQGLGLSGEQYRAAIQSGVTIAVPAERIVTLTDKPYWAKLKGLIGRTPETNRIVETEGAPTPAPRAALPAAQSPAAPRIEGEAVQVPKTAPEAAPALPEPVTKALAAPVSPRLLETIAAFTPQESTAFGRRIIERINEAVGTKITPTDTARAGIPENVKVSELPSQDGRPAAYEGGQIKLYVPDLLRDLKALSEGKRILAHEGEGTRVYELKQGETLEQLAVRYVQDVLIHEAAHGKTVNIEDNTKMQQLRQEVIQAIANKDKAAETQAKVKMQQLLRELETKAIEYERLNREQLKNELFGSARPRKLQRQINETVEGGEKGKVTMTEEEALRRKLRAQEQGARAGKDAGIKEATTKFSQVLEKVRDRQASIADKRKTLIEYAKAFLPFREQGKFLKAINNTITQKDFLEVLERMQKATSAVERGSLIRDITKELKDTKVRFTNKVPNAKFEYEAQKKLDRIRRLQSEYEVRAKELRAAGNKDANAYELAQAEIADVISKWQIENPDGVLPSEILTQVQELRMVGLRQMTLPELRGVLGDVQSIKETGRTKKELERFNRDSEIMRVKDMVTDVITGGRENPRGKFGIRPSQTRPTAFEAVGDFFTLKHAGFEELLDALSKFDKGSKPYQSGLSERFSTHVRDAFSKQNEGEIAKISEVNKLLIEAYGFVSNRDMSTYLNRMREKATLTDVRMADGTLKNIEITPGEALDLYMKAQDDTIASTLSEGMNLGDDALGRIFGLLSETDKKVADKMLAYYRDYYKEINAVYSKEYGVDLPFNENYSPIARDVETSIPENVLLAKEMKSYATAKNNSLKSRVKNDIEFKLQDAFMVLASHINKMEHYKAWSEPMYEMRRVFGDKEMRRTIEDYHGRKYIREVDSFLNDFARDGVDRAKIVPFVDRLRENTTAALLGLPNWKVPVKQLTGVMNYWIEIPTKEFFTGTTGFWSDPVGKAKFLYENSPILRERFGNGYERDVKAALRTDHVKRLTQHKNAVRELMFTGIRNADRLTVYSGSWAAYRWGFNEARRNGKTIAEARAAGIKLAEDITNRVQESSQLDTLSPIQRGGSLAKAATMFQSQPSKYVRILWNIARNWKYGRGDKMTHVRRFVVLWFVQSTIYNLVDQLLKKEEYRSTPGEFAARVALGPLTYPLILGQLFQSIYGWTQGDDFAYNVSPILSIADDVQKGVQQINSSDIEEALTYFIEAMGKTAGVPTPQFMRPLRQYLKDEGASPQGAAASF